MQIKNLKITNYVSTLKNVSASKFYNKQKNFLNQPFCNTLTIDEVVINLLYLI